MESKIAVSCVSIAAVERKGFIARSRVVGGGCVAPERATADSGVSVAGCVVSERTKAYCCVVGSARSADERIIALNGVVIR